MRARDSIYIAQESQKSTDRGNLGTERIKASICLLIIYDGSAEQLLLVQGQKLGMSMEQKESMVLPNVPRVFQNFLRAEWNTTRRRPEISAKSAKLILLERLGFPEMGDDAWLAQADSSRAAGGDGEDETSRTPEPWGAWSLMGGRKGDDGAPMPLTLCRLGRWYTWPSATVDCPMGRS